MNTLRSVSRIIADKLKSAGGIALGIIVILAMIAIAGVFLGAAEVLSEYALPWLLRLSALGFVVLIAIMLPMSLIGRCRPFTSTATLVISYIFGATVWMDGLVLTMTIWGDGAVIFGLFFMGVGIVPMAMLATLFHGMWARLTELVVLIALTFGSRFLSFWIAAIASSDREPQDDAPGEETRAAVPYRKAQSLVGGIHGKDESDKKEVSAKCGDTQVILADIRAMQAYCCHDAKQWWNNTGRQSAVCDACNSAILRGGGFLLDSSLLCESCFDPKADPGAALKNLQDDPDYYGEVLVKARSFSGTQPRQRWREPGSGPTYKTAETGQPAKQSSRLQDLGKHLALTGSPQKTALIYPSLDIDEIAVVGTGKYCTTRVQPLDGNLYCVTFDFGDDVLGQILARATLASQEVVIESLTEDFDSIRHLRLPDPVNIGVSAVLGDPQQGLEEIFIPLVITDVF
jgi:hypothetical protein